MKVLVEVVENNSKVFTNKVDRFKEKMRFKAKRRTTRHFLAIIDDWIEVQKSLVNKKKHLDAMDAMMKGKPGAAVPGKTFKGICAQWLQGTCKKGEKCEFGHGEKYKGLMVTGNAAPGKDNGKNKPKGGKDKDGKGKTKDKDGNKGKKESKGGAGAGKGKDTKGKGKEEQRSRSQSQNSRADSPSGGKKISCEYGQFCKYKKTCGKLHPGDPGYNPAAAKAKGNTKSGKGAPATKPKAKPKAKAKGGEESVHESEQSDSHPRRKRQWRRKKTNKNQEPESERE